MSLIFSSTGTSLSPSNITMAERSDPPCRVLVRSKTAVDVYTVPERAEDVVEKKVTPILQGSTSLLRLLPDGSAAFALLRDVGVVKIGLNPVQAIDKPVAFLPSTASVQMMDVSPSGTYLLTWERLTDDCPENLKVWRAADGALLGAFTQKALKREAWPNLQWTHDEQFAFLLVNGQVHVYPASAFGQAEVRYTDKLRINGITSLSLPRTSSMAVYLFTSFCPGTKDKPARASLHEYLPGKTDAGPHPAKLSKSLFQAEEMKVHWSPQGDTALITLQTSVDTSGESYYGSSQLFLLRQLGTDVDAVELPGSQGPVLDVAWMPNPSAPPCFVSVAGKMPAMAALHHGQTGNPMFLFGHAHRNTVAWAPHGRFLCLAGFGNLAGGMGFWDRNKMKLCPGSPQNVLGNLRAEAVVGYGWSPDSRLFLTSTTSPRMNVDNGLRLFRYSGEELLNVPWDNARYHPDQLLEAVFVPSLLTTYPDRPQSPVPSAASEPDAVAAPTPTPTASASRYVPPSARNRAGRGTSFSERLRREKEEKVQVAQKIVDKPKVAKNAATGQVIPGLVVETAKSKSALKREKAKLKKQQEEERKKAEEAVVEATQEVQPAVDPEKRARKIKKTLKQIEDLTQKDAAELNDDQKAKIASESELQEELAKLGL